MNQKNYERQIKNLNGKRNGGSAAMQKSQSPGCGITCPFRSGQAELNGFYENKRLKNKRCPVPNLWPDILYIKKDNYYSF
jgi:hypothetical protein